jgi:putative two-component system response regulator
LIGERICACLWLSKHVSPIIRHHHERWDGAGYVDGLAGADIPILARVVSVVDAFDAMSSDRPYRRALPGKTVTKRLAEGAGTQWDPDIVQAFIDLAHREHLSSEHEPAQEHARRHLRAA